MAILVIDGHSFETPYFSGSNFELSNSPQLEIKPIQNPDLRSCSKHLNYIAEPFIALVVLAHSLYEEPDYTFYLVVYKLHRRKDFFLIV
jgi:hypothetical protein